jgi:phosphotransferase system IIB component
MVNILNSFMGLKNVDDYVHITRLWQSVKDNSNISAKESLGYYELKEHKPWFEEG